MALEYQNTTNDVTSRHKVEVSNITAVPTIKTESTDKDCFTAKISWMVAGLDSGLFQINISAH